MANGFQLRDFAPYLRGIGRGLLTHRAPIAGIGLGIMQGGAELRQREQREQLADSFLPADQISQATHPMLLAARQLTLMGDPRGVQFAAQAMQQQQEAEASREIASSLAVQPSPATESPYRQPQLQTPSVVQRMGLRPEDLSLGMHQAMEERRGEPVTVLDQVLASTPSMRDLPPPARAEQAATLQQVAPTLPSAPVPRTLMPVAGAAPPASPPALGPPATGGALPPRMQALLQSENPITRRRGIEQAQKFLTRREQAQMGLARDLAKERRREARDIRKEGRKTTRERAERARLEAEQPVPYPADADDRIRNAAFKKDLVEGRIENTPEARAAYAAAEPPTPDEKRTINATANIAKLVGDATALLERGVDPTDLQQQLPRFLNSRLGTRFKAIVDRITLTEVTKFAATTFTDRLVDTIKPMVEADWQVDPAQAWFNLQTMVDLSRDELGRLAGPAPVFSHQKRASDAQLKLDAISTRLQEGGIRAGEPFIRSGGGSGVAGQPLDYNTAPIADVLRDVGQY